MTLKRKPILDRVLPILCDPITGTTVKEEESAFVTDTARYPIVRGIPRFVPGDEYVSSFSFEWNTHNKTQLDAFRGGRSSEDQFIQKTGFGRDDLQGKLVLDAGVGAGRYADVVSRWGADLIGVDLSYAVEAAYLNFADRPNVWIAQADIGKLPFKPGSFDVIFSIGVLHHTPDTEAYFKKLVPLLKPGGQIAIWVYPKEGDYVVRKEWIPFVNKLPPHMFYTWCRWFVPWAHQRLDKPLIGIFKRLFPFSAQGLGLENDILDTFDGYSPRYHGIHSPVEVQKWFNEAGLINVYSPNMKWNTCMRGVKPVTSV